MDSRLLTGTVEMLILEVMATGPSYGYEIVQTVTGRSQGYFELKEGSLYPALHRLERANLIVGAWQDTPNNVRRRYYKTTAKGNQALVDRFQEWQRFTQAMNSIMLPETT